MSSKQEAMEVRAQINSLQKRSESLKDQYHYSLYSAESSKEEVYSILTTWKEAEKTLTATLSYYSYLINPSIIRDVDDLRNFAFGLMARTLSKQESSIKWYTLYNSYNSDKEMISYFTRKSNKKDDIKKLLLKELGLK